MRLLFAIVFLFAGDLCAQNLQLENLETIIKESSEGKYYSFLESSGYNLRESKEEGREGFYEKWVMNDDEVYLSIQHNPNFGFTKLIFSSTDKSNKAVISSVMDQLKNEYSLKTIDNQDYYIKEDIPGVTVHLIAGTSGSTAISGLLFFYKF